MELEEIISRLEFLEEERRKNKNQINALERRLTSFESVNKTLREEITGVTDQATKFDTASQKLDQMDSALSKIRKDFNKSIQNLEKSPGNRADSSSPMDIGSFNKLASELRKGLTTITEVKKSLQAKVAEEIKLAKTIDQVQGNIKNSLQQDAEFRDSMKMIEDAQRMDSKKIADLSAEISALRKKSESNLGKGGMLTEKIKDLELKFLDFQGSEGDRKQSLVGLIEKQSLQQLERNRIWKEWQSRFDVFSEKAEFFEKQTQMLEVTLQSLKSAQEKFDEINQKLERRINELTEMQRLTDEKFRQDWMSFRAEDQKRWANYNVGQDEMQRETARQLEGTVTRLSSLEELTHDIRDAIVALGQETNQRLQAIIKMSNEWMDSNERMIDIGS